MLTLRKSKERGHANHGWLDTYHSFSFADYHDPHHMGFSVLRVINEDEIDAKAGFPTHGHKNMEIVTYVTEGALEHKDSMGNSTVINPGDVQRMSAGTGVRHSEFNHHADRKTKLLQIWILTASEGIEPSYEQKSFVSALEKNNFVLALSPNGESNSVSHNQDVKMYIGKFKSGEGKEYTLSNNRTGWIQIVLGKLDVNNLKLEAGDGLAIEDESLLILKATTDVEFLFFDLPK